MAGMAELGLTPAPTYRDCYPKGRERLLALSEKAPPLQSQQQLKAAPPPPYGARPPRMGVKDMLAARSPRPPPSQPIVRPTPIYASEQNLSDRLSHALKKGLGTPFRPAALASTPQAAGKFSGGAVAADDVVYYPTGAAPNNFCSPSARQQITPPSLHAQQHQQAYAESGNPANRRAAASSKATNQRLSTTTLDQLRLLYSSAPDFAELSLEDERTTHKAKQNRNSVLYDGRVSAANFSTEDPHYANLDELRLLADATSDLAVSSLESCQLSPADASSAAQSTNHQPAAAFSPQHLGGSSPTDSGYRSAPRHLAGCDNGAGPAANAKPLTTVVVVGGEERQSLEAGQAHEAVESAPSSPRSPRAVKKAPTPRARRNGVSSRYETSGATKEGSGRASSTRPLRDGSVDTLNTNVSLPEEFALERCPKLVELDRVPWNEKDVVTVLQRGRTRELVDRIAVDVVPRLTYLLQRPLIRISRELQRLCIRFNKCTKHDVQYAARIVLSGPLAESCQKAGIQATSLYAMGGFEGLKQSQSRRAALRFSVGKFQRWLCDAQIAPFIHEHASVYLAAVCECLLEEMVLHSITGSRHSSASSVRSPSSTGSAKEEMLSPELLDQAIVANPDFWGLLQDYEHLISSRTANGVLCAPHSAAHSPGPNFVGKQKSQQDVAAAQSVEQSMLATCVGSLPELGDLVARVLHAQSTSSHSAWKLLSTASALPWSDGALRALFHFMRCSQLAHTTAPSPTDCGASTPALFQLAHERPYLVLPPLIDWLRVSGEFCGHRQGAAVDADDVLQTARLLLPSIDSPPRLFRPESALYSGAALGPAACSQRFKQNLAFDMLATGRGELVPQALALLGPQKLNSTNEQGLTCLMLACLRGDVGTVYSLLDSGADANTSVPSQPEPTRWPNLIGQLAGWSPLCFAAAQRNLPLVNLLIDRCADIDNDKMLTDTPLQLAAACGDHDIVARLLACGADAYHSTLQATSESYGFKQRGSPSPLALAASHGHRGVLKLMLSKGQRGRAEESLSLAEYLAEFRSASAGQSSSDLDSPLALRSARNNANSGGGGVGLCSQLSKPQQRALQEAMYFAAEAAHLDIAMEIRNLGVPWNAHVWSRALAAAHEMRRRSLVQILLADFLGLEGGGERRLVDDISVEFVDDTLPLLFDILRSAKNDMTEQQVARILSQLYGCEPIANIKVDETAFKSPIDPSFVNNPELSDVCFSLDGRAFYAHRIVLANASARLKALALAADAHPVQVRGVTYDIFALLMDYLYRGHLIGGGKGLKLPDLLQLLSAARQFELHKLVAVCEALVSKRLTNDNCFEVYRFAKAQSAAQLSSYCEGYLLSHLAELLSDRETGEPLRKLIHQGGRQGALGVPDLRAALVHALSDRVETRIGGKFK